ncbi:MAG TPA: archaetidylserine decarboxylase [Leptospiraceae bacterium]|nr:archaetidylserine decarboxylase [Leptospirales bacterium]HMU81759.1 archaetidylserine decarboxylase [Leptospiraceae bacterium]HMW59348.1 archaetidylserine decarboxylase [Leptospiraceae bacterium]HMY45825.1 archaetidylserine decarboxylase [Leptospiraceae bacterium]HMZ37591.1 archaetidylserine decarboxylase [Leptospiraceae bacterium]
MNEIISYVSIPVISLILFAGLFLTIRFQGVQLRELLLSIKVLSGMMDQPSGKEQHTMFQAFLLSLAGVIGGSVVLAGTHILDSRTWSWFLIFAFIYAPIQFSVGATLSRNTRSIAVLAALALIGLQGVSQTSYTASIEMHLAWNPLAVGLIVTALSAGIVFAPVRIGASIFAWSGLLFVIYVIRNAFVGGPGSLPGLYFSTNPVHISSALLAALTLCEIARAPFLFVSVRSSGAKPALVSMLSVLLSPFVFAIVFYVLDAFIPSDVRTMSLAAIVGLVLWTASWMWTIRSFVPGSKGTLLSLAFALLPLAMQHTSYSMMVDILVFGSAAGGLALACFTVEAFLRSGEASQSLAELRESHRWEISKDIYLIFLTILPQNLVSRIFGWIAATPLPGFLREPIILAYSRAFGVTVEEAAKEIREYSSLNNFFIRYLKPGARPIEGDEKTIVSPVDGTVLRFGDITEGLLIQAKAMQYSLRDLLEFPDYLQDFEGGKFLVIYLSPRDYHRIHFPVGGTVPAFAYSPGDLFTVNPVAVERLDALFAKNERLATYIHNPRGTVALIKVGATNVGRIVLAYDSFKTNRWFRRPVFKRYATPVEAKRGDELGRFEMGSTVILLFGHNKIDFLPIIQEKNKVKFGQGIAKWK